MKKYLTLFFLPGLLLWAALLSAQPCNISGTYSIGPGGAYATLTAALNFLRANGTGGPVILELQANYTSTTETFPIELGSIPCVSATNNITVRPAAGATNLSISSNFNGTTISLSNARYITIDGRPGSTGISTQLTIRNATPGGVVYTGGSVVTFNNDASYNTLKYLNIKGVAYASSYDPVSGLISFLGSNAAITNGNTDNLVTNCNIGDSLQLSFNSIFSQGDPGKKNRNNKISNCFVFNYFSTEVRSSINGVYLGGNNENWEIAGNSFYQTADRNYGLSNHAININDTTSSGFWIHDNFIGGTYAYCSGAAQNYTGPFTGISIAAGSDNYSIIENNSVSNINWHNMSNLPGFTGIKIIKGKINCGGTQGNLIGSMSQRSSIVCTSVYLTNPAFSAIGVAEDLPQGYADSFFIRNNKIGGILLQRDPTNYLATTFSGVTASILRAYIQVTNNIIGSTTLEKSIETTADLLIGINISAHTADNTGDPNNPLTLDITGNQANHWFGYSEFILVKGGKAQIKNNLFRNMLGQDKSLFGVFLSDCFPGTIVSGNSFYSLQTKGTQPTTIAAVVIDRSFGVNVAGNFVRNFHSESASATFQGIQVATQSNGYGGNHIIQNNFISLGPDTIAPLASTTLILQGITVSTDNSNVSHNSVYIGGSGNLGFPSYAIQLNQEYRAFAAQNKIINNILQNNRTPGLGMPLIDIDYRITDTTNLLINNNIYHYTAASGILGQFKGIQYRTMRQWRAALKLDSNSVFGNPNFINPEGNPGTANLHLANPTPAEGQGLPDASVATDFDGDLRSNFTPVDIGADAGNYTTMDVDTPTLVHPNYSYQTAGTVYPYKVKIADNGSGIDSTGNNKPRMWFRRIYPSTSAWLSTPGALTAGTLKNGEWTFSPNFTTAGLILNAGDSVAYYFVAQDKSIPAKVGYSGADVTRHSTVNNQLTAPIIPNRLFIYGLFPDTVYVGTGQLYTSLTGTGGFFQASKTLQFNPVKPDVYVVITSNLDEYNIYNYSPPQGNLQTIHFITNTPLIKQVKNIANSGAILMFNNTANITIDGNVNGSGRYLQFINASTFSPSAATNSVAISGTAGKIDIENCIFNSNHKSSTGIITVNAPVIEKLVVRKNVFSSATGYAGLPSLQIYLYTSNSDSILITDNDFANFSQSGISMQIGGTAIPKHGKIIIDNNHFYQETTINAANTDAIKISAIKFPVSITNNYIGGAARNCAGTWDQSDVNPSVRGIYLSASADSTASIQNNMIRNIRVSGSYDAAFTGIYAESGIFNIGNIAGNSIGGGTADTSLYSKNYFTGILCSNTNSCSVINNQVSKIFSANFRGIDCTARNGSIKNNDINTCFISVSGASYSYFNGINATLDTGLIEANKVHHLYQKLTATSNCYGINAMALGGNGEVVIARNMINNLHLAAGFVLAGIGTGFGWFHIQNNEINLSNDSIASDVSLRGLFQYSSGNSSKLTRIHYNSIRLYGNPSGTKKSYAVYIEGGSPVTSFRNNLLYNQRTGGYGRHLAVGMLATTDIWKPGIAGNNLYVTADTGYVNEWRSNGTAGVNNWRTLSAGDGNSFFNTTARIPADSLFLSAAGNNLNIKFSSPFCWYVNDKGRGIADISGDIDVSAGVRSIDTLNGKTDIGADEFTTNAPLPVLPFSFCAGGTQSISSNLTALFYQWQANTGSGFFNINDNTNYSGTGSNNLTLTNIPSSWYGYQFRCMADASFTSPVSLEFTNNWTGAVNSDWSTAGNWSCNAVPDGNTDVIIASGTVVLNQNETCRSITVRPAATFTIANNATLTVTH